MAKTTAPTDGRTDPQLVEMWIDQLHALADQVDDLSDRAKRELGEEAERLGRLYPLSLTYHFASTARDWADKLRHRYLST
jgi:hypothetical protein